VTAGDSCAVTASGPDRVVTAGAIAGVTGTAGGDPAPTGCVTSNDAITKTLGGLGCGARTLAGTDKKFHRYLVANNGGTDGSRHTALVTWRSDSDHNPAGSFLALGHGSHAR